MKKILQLAIPVLLGILPVIGTEQAGIIEDPFFTKDGTARSISRVVENGSKIMTLVTATDQNETKNKLVEALCATVGWKNNDSEHYAQEIVNVQILCGSDFLEKKYTKALKNVYEELGNGEVRTLNGNKVDNTYVPQVIGEKVMVSSAKTYKRPDNTIYNETGVTLYYLMLEESRTPQSEFRHCQKEWVEFSRMKRITRHQVQIYTRTDVTQTLFKVINESEKVVLSTKITVELKPTLYEPEVPTCGHGNFPANYKIIS